MTDPIADMLTRIRNALAVRKAQVVIPLSKIKLNMAKILEREKWIEKVETKNNEIIISLKYENSSPAITKLKRISKPGCRVYVKHTELPIVLDGLGIAIISTPQGLMTNKEAKNKKVGGEVLCEIF